MLFMTSPLWELVWITGSGLNRRYVGSSKDMAEKNTTEFPNTESSNVIVTSAKCPNNEQNKKSNSLGLENQAVLNPETNHAPKTSQKLIFSGSPESVKSMHSKGIYVTGSHGDVKLDKKITEGVVRNASDIPPTDINENIKGFDVNIPATDAIDTVDNRVSLLGEYSNSGGADSLYCHKKDPHLEVAEAENGGNHNRSLSETKQYQKPSMPASNYADCNKAENERSISSSGSTEHGNEEHCAEENGLRAYSNFSIFELLGQRCLSNTKHNTVKEIEITSGFDLSPQIADENEIPQANENEIPQAKHIDNFLVIRSHSVENVNTKSRYKGKEGYGDTSNEKEQSNESVESSNSSKKSSNGKRAIEFESNKSLGSKRFKLDDNEGSCSRSLVKKNGSFLNWMSTLTKGVATFCRSTPSEFYDGPPKSLKDNSLCLYTTNEETVSIEKVSMGFTAVFQSLYLPRELENRKELKSSLMEHRPDELKELDDKLKRQSSEECSVIKMVHPSSSAKNIIACAKESHNPTLNYAPNNKSAFSENLWISRFLRKDSEQPIRALKCGFGVEPENENRAKKFSFSALNTWEKQLDNHLISQSQCQNAPTSSKSHRPEVGPTKTPFHHFKDPEERACLIVKGFDSSYNLVESPPYETPKNCIFEEKNVHCAKGSSNGFATSLKNMQFRDDDIIHHQKELQQFIKSNEGDAYASTCFNKNVTCNSSYNAKNGWISLSDRLGNLVCNLYDRHDRKVAQEVKLGSGETRVQNSSGAHSNWRADTFKAQVARHSKRLDECIGDTISLEKQFNSGFRKSDVRENQLTPLCKLAANEVNDEQACIFEAIRKLRLSRTEMMRLLTSPDGCKNLEGFFVRMRLGQWQRGLGETAYHVARINGVRCERTLSISIGKFTYMVDGRFVSNHDYLEDELKAWWSNALSTGEIPSNEELNRKISERVKLGL